MAFTPQSKTAIPAPSTKSSETGATVPAPSAATPEDKTPIPAPTE